MNKRYRGGDADCQSSNGDGIDESCAMLPSLFLISPAKVRSSNGNRGDYTFVAAAAAVAMIPIEALLVNQKEMLRILIMIISVRLERSTRVDGNNHGWQGASYMVSFFFLSSHAVSFAFALLFLLLTLDYFRSVKKKRRRLHVQSSCVTFCIRLLFFFS